MMKSVRAVVKTWVQKSCVILVMVPALVAAGNGQSSHEIWKAKLDGEGGIMNFDRSIRTIWAHQEGVAFLTPERLLVYQVNRTLNPAPLAKQSSTGGGGNFVLLIRIFDAPSGREIKRLRASTSADFSAVLPTHDGKFIVRAGNLLDLYSPDFVLLAERQLSLEKTAPIDYWQMSITPAGTQVALVHQKRYVDPDLPVGDMKASEVRTESDVEIVDADTFKSLRKIHLPYYLPVFSATERYLLTTTPAKPLTDAEFGTMDMEGHWTALHPAGLNTKHCTYNYEVLHADLMVARGCEGLVVFSESGDKLLSLSSASGWFGSVFGADDYLALERDEMVTPIHGRPYREPSRIEVYNLKSSQRVVSARVESNVSRYAVSAKGVLAIVEGDALKVFQPQEHEPPAF